MNTFLKADIFFVITGVAVVIITICLAVVFYYVIRIVRDLNYLSKRARTEGEDFLQDLRRAREDMKEKGASLMSFLTSILTFAITRSKKPSRKNGKKGDKKFGEDE